MMFFFSCNLITFFFNMEISARALEPSLGCVSAQLVENAVQNGFFLNKIALKRQFPAELKSRQGEKTLK